MINLQNSKIKNFEVNKLKTQVIATLTNYAHEDLKKKVLLVCPSNKARDELVKRCKNVFNLDISSRDKDLNGHHDCISTAGLMNSKKTEEDWFLNLLSGYDWILVDEVEYTINPGGNFIYKHTTGAERFYSILIAVLLDYEKMASSEMRSA